MTDKELIQWAKDNSSGCYRPSMEIAIRFEESLRLLGRIADLSLSLSDSPESLKNHLTKWAREYKNKN